MGTETKVVGEGGFEPSLQITKVKGGWSRRLAVCFRVLQNLSRRAVAKMFWTEPKRWMLPRRETAFRKTFP